MDWAGCYERLRQQRLDHGAVAGGWGLALLIHRGLAAWMRACSVMAAAPSEGRGPAGALPSLANEPARQPPAVSPGVACQVTHVLAQMILQTRQEVLR